MLVQLGENDEREREGERERERNSFYIYFVHIFQEIETCEFSSWMWTSLIIKVSF